MLISDIEISKNIFFNFSILLLMSVFYSCRQPDSQNKQLGRVHAETELKIALSNKKSHNIINDHTLLIKDSVTAIKIAEPILFGIYGEENIKKQRPYEAYLIDKHWVLSGALNSDIGGAFLIIINSMDGKVLKITHGK